MSDVDGAIDAWQQWCRTLESTGTEALRKTMTDDDIDVAEGVRYLSRIARLTLDSYMENCDPAHPYFTRSLGPEKKMGGDNPGGLYLSAPINGTDTFHVAGTRGSALWVSCITQRGPGAHAAGLGPFGGAIFTPDLLVETDDTFELVVSPDEHPGNWIASDEHCATLLIRQFFGTWDDVRPMDLTIENVTRRDHPPAPLTVDDAAGRLARSAGAFSMLVPLMQSEMLAKGATINSFATDIGDPTSNLGGVPGGNAVTSRWRLEPDEALLVEVTPPVPCPYWDVQVGNGWYESWDYRHHFSGLTCAQAAVDEDGSVTLVLSQRDPGTANWLETAHHREGHIAIRWQLTEGQLPIPRCTVVDVDDVRARTGLPAVAPAERAQQRRALLAAVEQRFRL